METIYSPIQVVLDVRRFQDERVRPPGASLKDFFVGDDQAFIAHRQRIHSELSSVGSRLVASSAGGIGFMRVRMREEALAKSHRCRFPLEMAVASVKDGRCSASGDALPTRTPERTG